MKPLIAIATLTILAVPCACFAQDSHGEKTVPGHEAKQDESKYLPGFLGVEWGDQYDVVKKKLIAKGFEIDPKHTKPGVITTKPTKIAGHFAFGAVFKIGPAGFHTAVVVYPSTPDDKAIDLYKEIKELITKKYSEPQDDFHTFKSPYEEGQGDEILAIKVGKADYSSYWHFPSKKKGGEDNIISLEISRACTVEMTYQNSELVQKEIDKNKEQDTKDL